MKILAIKHQSTKKGKPCIMITTAQGLIWPSIGQWRASGASPTLGNYVGGNVEVDYYAEGDEMLGGDLCTKDNTIVRAVYPSENPVVLANSLAIESKNKMEEVSDLASMFAKSRAEAKAKSTAAKEIVEPEGKVLAGAKK